MTTRDHEKAEELQHMDHVDDTEQCSECGREAEAGDLDGGICEDCLEEIAEEDAMDDGEEVDFVELDEGDADE